MLWNSKPSFADVRELIACGAEPDVVARKLYNAAKGKYYIDVGNQECLDLARDFGKTLKRVDDIEVFWNTGVGCVPEKDRNPRELRSQWSAITTQVTFGFVEADGVKSVADALKAACMTGGGAWDDWVLERLEAELIKKTVPLLLNKKDILDFGARLKTFRGLMLLSIGLGFVPANSFEQALEWHKAKLKAEEERRRQTSVF
jgi:hypothetical protein